MLLNRYRSSVFHTERYKNNILPDKQANPGKLYWRFIPGILCKFCPSLSPYQQRHKTAVQHLGQWGVELTEVNETQKL